MRLATAGFGLAATLVIAGCSSNTTDTGNTGGSTSCKATLTLAVTGSYTCTALASYVNNGNLSGISISVPGSATLAIAINLNGPVTTNTYTASTSGTSGSGVVNNGTLNWINSNAAGSATGTFSITLSSVSTLTTNANGTVYTIHGTYDGTFAASPGTSATGTVQVHVVF